MDASIERWEKKGQSLAREKLGQRNVRSSRGVWKVVLGGVEAADTRPAVTTPRIFPGTTHHPVNNEINTPISVLSSTSTCYVIFKGTNPRHNYLFVKNCARLPTVVRGGCRLGTYNIDKPVHNCRLRTWSRD